ncbi:hypothetical protein ACFUAG_06725 [Streptomyces sp. NPDC057193]|uniref:hypothetical protein n=1 Tax=Streptomyces sp. NPDC057193 TaxID=3346043 RepID=UPI00362CF993
MDPDAAAKLLESVAHLVSMLSSGQRNELLDRLGMMAQAESDLLRREFARPAGTGPTRVREADKRRP